MIKNIGIFLLKLFIALIGLVLAITLSRAYEPFLFIIFIPFIFIPHILFRRAKNLSDKAKSILLKKGYTILSERPLKFSENDFNIRFTVLVNGLPVSRYAYINQWERMFTISDQEGNSYDLQCTITYTWNFEYEVKIDKIIR